MTQIIVGNAIKSALVTAFTLAVALIWKDVIIDAINAIVPAPQELFYNFLAAFIATVVLIIVIYIIQRESEAEAAIKKLLKH